MADFKDVSPIKSLRGMTVLSLASGNKLGQIEDLFIDPVNGVLLGLSVNSADGNVAGLAYESIYSFGPDALMVEADDSIGPLEASGLQNVPTAENLFETKIITESGEVLGRIANVFVTLKPPPFVLYEVRLSLLDKLLGREFFIPASAGHALSDDFERLVVPDATAETAASDLTTLVDHTIAVVSTFTPPELPAAVPVEDEEETIVRLKDEEETLVRERDEEDTLVRRPRKAT